MRGRKYDVIIVGKLDWAMLPGEQRLQLLEKVSAGTGLVYVGPPAGNKELEIVFGGKAAPEGARSSRQRCRWPRCPRSRASRRSRSSRPRCSARARGGAELWPDQVRDGIRMLDAAWTEPSGTYASGVATPMSITNRRDMFRRMSARRWSSCRTSTISRWLPGR